MKKIRLLFFIVMLFSYKVSLSQFSTILMIPEDTIVCEGSSVTYFPSPVNPNSTYVWTGNFTGSPLTGAGLNISLFSPINDWVVHMQENNSGNIGPVVSSIPINVIAESEYPISFITGPDFVWVGDTVFYSTLATNYNTHYWSVSSLTLADSTDNAIAVVFTDTGTYGIDLLTANLCGWHNEHKDVVVIPASNCSVSFTLYPDTAIQQHWYLVPTTSGIPPITYSWNWGDGSSSTGSNPSHTYDTTGYYNICVSISDANGCSTSYCDSSTYVYKTGAEMITINVVDELPSDIKEAEMEIIEVYPNPANNQVFIKSLGTVTSVSIFDITGREIKNVKLKQQNTEIDISSLEKGIYVFVINENVIERVIKE